MPSANSPDDKFFRALMKTSTGIRTLLRDRASQLGLNHTEARILMFVLQHPRDRTTVTNMAEEFDRTKPTISNHVDSLVEAGYLERSPASEDRRRTNLTLTSQGRSLGRNLLNWPEDFTPPSEELTPDEMASYHEYLLSFLDEMHERGSLPVAKTCTSCRYLTRSTDCDESYRCEFLEQPMQRLDLRVDCEVHEPEPSPEMS